MSTIKRFNNLQVSQKIICIIFSLLLFFSTIVVGTLAWYSLQNELNSFQGFSPSLHTVILQKYERDVAGNETTITIANAEFYLYHILDDGNEKQIGGRYLTDDAGQIVLDSALRPGEYYFLETNPGYGYDFDSKDGEVIRKYYFTITGDTAEEKVLVYAYNQRLAADLTITKEVVNHDGSALTEDWSTAFVFTVTFNDDGAYRYMIDGIEKEQLIRTGETLHLAHGQIATIIGLPVGLQYKVTEDVVEDYSISSTNHQGNITVDGAHVSFVNTYRPGYGSLDIRKNVRGAGADLRKAFDFTVVFSDGGSYVYRIDNEEEQTLVSGGTITLRHDQVATFIDLPFGLEYRVTEADYSQDGYLATIQDVQGQIIRGKEAITFDNVFDEGYATGTLGISKQVIGLEDIDKDKEFIFTVRFNEEGVYTYTIINNGESSEQGTEYTLPNTGQISLKHGETAIFTSLRKGLKYTVIESVSNGYIGNFKEVNGEIVGNYHIDVHFTNLQLQDIPELGESTLTIKKIVDGEVPKGDENKSFIFTLIIDGKETEFSLQHGQEHMFILPLGATYEVLEKDYTDDGYALISLINGQGTGEGVAVEVIVTNRYIECLDIEIPIVKKWQGAESMTLPNSITVHLKNGEDIVDSIIITPDAQGDWTHIFTAPKYDVNGKEVQYTVSEVEIPNYKATIQATDDGYHITNTYVPQPMDITVSKLWEGNDINRPESVEVQLYNNGEAYGDVVTLSQDNNWTYTWSNLASDITWTVDEPIVPEGYQSSISGNAQTGFFITNTYLGSEASEVSSPPENVNTASKPPGSTPKTGDFGSIMPWLFIIVISILILRYVLFHKKKNN